MSSTPNPDLILQQLISNNGGTPSPWFTIANQFVPRNLHEVIRWARYITLQSPTTTEVIRKLCTYPITEFIVDTESEELRKKYKQIFDSFKLKQTLADIGFDYHTLGNVFASIYFPIHRILTCPGCKMEYSAKRAEFLEFKNWVFTGECPNCAYKGPFLRKDQKSMNIADMNIIKWDPENIAVAHNPITGEHEYYYKIPNSIKRKIQTGSKLYVNSVPWGFIEAVKRNQDFKFDAGNIFHLRNLSTGATVEGCCIPPLISLYSLVFYQATLRKANEAIAMEHMNPMRVVFPQPTTANADPSVAMSLKNFVERMDDALKKHKRDKNYIVIAPGPVGYQPIGGEGKNLLVSQEIQQAEEQILMSLGVSKELLSGTTNWTSSTVGLRLLHNTMLSYSTQILDLIKWIVAKVCTYLNIVIVDVTMTPFKLADDDVLKANMIQLLQSGDISLTTLFESFGLDFHEELERMKEDAVAKAQNQIEAKFEVDQATYLAAKKTGDRLDKNTDYQAILVQAEQIANGLTNSATMMGQATPGEGGESGQGGEGEQMQSGPDMAMNQEMLSELKINNYPLYVMVMKLMEEKRAQASSQAPLQPGQGAGAPGGAADGGAGTPDPQAKQISKY
jgi:hypothetical protein